MVNRQVRLIEIIGSSCGIAGAFIAAQGLPYLMPSAYQIWILSSLALIYVTLRTRLYFMATNQLVFFGINVMGVMNW